MLEKDLYKDKGKTKATLDSTEPTITIDLPKKPKKIEKALDEYDKIILYSLTGQELPNVPKIGNFPEKQLTQGTHGIILENADREMKMYSNTRNCLNKIQMKPYQERSLDI